MKKTATGYATLSVALSHGFVSELTTEEGSSENKGRHLAIMIVEARYERIHAALMLAVTACALGQNVTLFGMGSGVCAFCRNWDSLEQAEREESRVAAGVAGLEVLRTTLFEFGEVDFFVCDSGLKSMNFSDELLCEQVRVTGLPTFIERCNTAQLAVF